MKTKKNKLKFKRNKENKDIVKEVEKAHKDTTGENINLEAKKADDTVNGYIKTWIEGKYKIAEVVYYLEDKDPDFEIYEYNGVTYSRGSKVTIRRVVGA